MHVFLQNSKINPHFFFFFAFLKSLVDEKVGNSQKLENNSKNNNSTEIQAICLIYPKNKWSLHLKKGEIITFASIELRIYFKNFFY